jgi:HEAT repeat protein
MKLMSGIAAIAVGLGLAGPVSAQESAEERDPIAWDGTKQDGPALLKEIAAARVALDVEGDLRKVAARLQELSLRASEAHGFGGQAEALVQAALARAELQVRLGDPAQAVEELRHVVPARLELDNTTLRFTSPSGAMERAFAAARADPRLARRLAELEGQARGDRGGAPDSLQRLVDAAFEAEQYESIVQIGFPAFERFAERVRADTEAFPGEAGTDPLPYLIRLDERRAARFLAEHLDAAGYLWKKRLLRAMAEENVLENEGTWTSTRPFVCLEPEWLELVERLLGERETARDALPFFAAAEERDALSDGLNAAFRTALSAFGADFATAAVQVLDHPGVVPSAQPALEAVLELPDARLRRFAAKKLVNCERSEALLARSADPDPEVRLQVVRALDQRERLVFQRAGLPAVGIWSDQRISGRDAAAVRRLLADEQEEIRAAAVALLHRMEEPPQAELLMELAEDPSHRVRAALVSVERLPPEARARLLQQLARDPARPVLAALDEHLDGASQEEIGPIGTAPGPYLAALEVRWRDRGRPLEPYLADRLLTRLLQTAEGTRALVGWTLSEPTPETFARVAELSRKEHLLALPDELLARLLASSADFKTWNKVWGLLQAEPGKRVVRDAAMRLLLAMRSAPRLVRLAAASLAADESAGFREALLGLLRDPSWKERAPDAQERAKLRECAARFEPAPRSALALSVLRDPSISSEVADAFVSAYQTDAPGGRELTQAVLERWFRPAAPFSSAVNAALHGLGSVPDLARRELLEQALNVPAYAFAVVDAIADLADPAYLPLLRRAMKAEWMPADDRDDLQGEAAEALGSFDDDQAVELLLAGLRSNDDYVRGICQESLVRIRTYREQVETWRERGRATPTRASALAELLALLADPDALVRKEAARGIAALGAVEALPELIRALADPDPGVRAAAQQALERLNAAPPPAPAGG